MSGIPLLPTGNLEPTVPTKRQMRMQWNLLFTIPSLKEESGLPKNYLRFIGLIDVGKLPLADTKALLDKKGVLSVKKQKAP